ncbi:MAG TPA: hypothetical protein VGJ29_02645 [Vicinamibacterales bacterium]|jgi:hypothetical protein
MPKQRADFEQTFATLRAVLRGADKNLLTTVDKRGDFQVADAKRTDRIGRPLFVAGVQIKKNYVSYHLMPAYACPELLTGLSPSLKKRMQGKACFNFTAIAPEHVAELKTLTKRGITRFKNAPLAWE